MFEIYKAYKGKKTYIVSDEQFHETVAYAKKHFKVSEARIVCEVGWILNKELWLEDPENKKAVKHWVAYTR